MGIGYHLESSVGKSDNSRGIGKMGITPDELVSAEETGGEWISRFLFALEQANTETLLSLLSEDAVLLSDGGGKALAAIHPIVTRDCIARFLLGLIRKACASQYKADIRVELRPLNGQTGFVISNGEHIETVGFLHIEQETIRNIRCACCHNISRKGTCP